MGFVSGSEKTAQIAITQMVDDATAQLKPAKINLAFSAVCNVAHQVTLGTTRGALLPDSLATETQGPFLKEVRYRATAQWGATTVTLAADGSGPRDAVEDIATARVGDLSIEIAVDGGNNDLTTPVLAGSYSDILTLRVGARL
jgi:hypothetical protein